MGSIIRCDSIIGCNIIEGHFSCKRMEIYAQSYASDISIICRESSCEEMKVNISDDTAYIHCIGDQSCYDSIIMFQEMTPTSVVSCFSLNSVIIYSFIQMDHGHN